MLPWFWHHVSILIQVLKVWARCTLTLNIQTLRKQRQAGSELDSTMYQDHLKAKPEKWARIASRTMIYGLISCILRYVLYNTCVLLGSNGIKSILHKQLTWRQLYLFRLDLKINSEQLDKTDYQSSTYTPPSSVSQGSPCHFPKFNLTHNFLESPSCCSQRGNQLLSPNLYFLPCVCLRIYLKSF